MTLRLALLELETSVLQADRLIANAHQFRADGDHFLPELDRKQITVAAFLNIFIAWETFIEATISMLLSGSPTINNVPIQKFAAPINSEAAKKMLIGINRYFDFGNHNNIRIIAPLYFEEGRPFQPHINAIAGYLDDLRTMRNCSAHITSTTQTALNSLALRLRGSVPAKLTLYDLLISQMPSGTTVLETYKQYLLTAASLIAHG